MTWPEAFFFSVVVVTSTLFLQWCIRHRQRVAEGRRFHEFMNETRKLLNDGAPPPAFQWAKPPTSRIAETQETP